MKVLRAKNWHKFQHYRTRRPPWIKIHRELLDDATYQCLPDASRALAVDLWLIASESSDALIRLSRESLAFRLRKTVEWLNAALKPLIESGLFIEEEPASTVPACGQHDATSESETQTETYSEKITGRRAISSALRLPGRDGPWRVWMSNYKIGDPWDEQTRGSRPEDSFEHQFIPLEALALWRASQGLPSRPGAKQLNAMC